MDPTAEEPQPPDAKRVRILIVEDNADCANSLALCLRLHGYPVDVAYDGPGALDRAQATLPDIVFLDIGLPGMDGFEVAAWFKRETLPHPPLLIAVTGYGQDEFRRRSREMGIQLHLVKPVDPEELLRILERYERFLASR